MVSNTVSGTIPKYLSSTLFFRSHCNSVANNARLSKLVLGQGFSAAGIPFLPPSDSVNMNKYLRILCSLKLNKNYTSSLVTSCPGVYDLSFLEKWKSSLHQLEDKNIPSSVTDILLDYSRKLCIDPDNLRRCVLLLEELGLQIWTIKRVLERFPGVIALGEDEIRFRLGLLKSFSLNVDEIDRVVYLIPEFLSYGVETRLAPLFNEFKTLGFCKNRLRSEILNNPTILTMECGEFSRCLQLITSLKGREATRAKIHKEGKFKGVIEVKKRVDFLCKHGIILRDAFKILWKEPRVILYCLQSLSKKMEYLEKTMGLSLACVCDVPEYLGVSLEKRIVPRVRVIEQLRAENVICDDVGLDVIVKMSRMRFYNLYVKPYPQCENIYGRLFCEAEVNGSLGLWKLVTPQRPSHSRKDVHNFKLFNKDVL